jgi:hypothetical protein
MKTLFEFLEERKTNKFCEHFLSCDIIEEVEKDNKSFSVYRVCDHLNEAILGFIKPLALWTAHTNSMYGLKFSKTFLRNKFEDTASVLDFFTNLSGICNEFDHYSIIVSITKCNTNDDVPSLTEADKELIENHNDMIDAMEQIISKMCIFIEMLESDEFELTNCKELDIKTTAMERFVKDVPIFIRINL